jgi:hypothetical protein
VHAPIVKRRLDELDLLPLRLSGIHYRSAGQITEAPMTPETAPIKPITA